MGIADPKTYQPPKQDDVPVTQSDFMAAMQALITQIGSASPADKERAVLEAERLMLERERITREMPENKQAPGISVFSNPRGDLADPKPDLKVKMFWVGYPMEKDTLTPLEVDLLNRMEPGDYRVTKTDGSQIPFTVEAKKDNRGEIQELNFHFRCKNDDDKHNHNSMVSYLQQALGDKIASTAELLAEVAKLKAELVGARG